MSCYPHARIVDSHEAGSPEWHAQRTARLGGSEIAAVLGLSAYQSPLSLWLTKTGAIKPEPGNALTEWGNRLEPVVMDKWYDSHDDWTRADVATFVRDGWMIARPDSIAYHDQTGERAVLEIKTAARADDWGRAGDADEEGDPIIPPAYLLQVRWYMHVLDLARAHVAVLIAGSDYREYEIVQRADHVDLMLTAGRAFIDSLATGDRPDIDTHDRTYQALRQANPDIDTGQEAELDPDMADAYLTAKTAADEADATYTGMKSAVLDAMGTARVAVSEGRKIARRQTNSPAVPPWLVCAVRKPKQKIVTRKDQAA